MSKFGRAPAPPELVRRVLGILASFALPGAGQIALGRSARGTAWFLVRVLSVYAFFVASAVGVPLHVGVVAVIWCALLGASVIDVVFVHPARRGLPPWRSVLGGWAALVASLFVLRTAVEDLCLTTHSIGVVGMEPTLQPGDEVVVDRTRYGLRLPLLPIRLFDRRTPRRGEVIAFVDAEAPASSLVSRIVGLAGEAVTSQTGERVLVPPGHVFVRGDATRPARGSELARAVPVDNILGRVGAICWSAGPTGVRWDRLGRRVR